MPFQGEFTVNSNSPLYLPGEDRATRLKNVCIVDQEIPLLGVYSKEKIQRYIQTLMHIDVYYSSIHNKGNYVNIQNRGWYIHAI